METVPQAGGGRVLGVHRQTGTYKVLERRRTCLTALGGEDKAGARRSNGRIRAREDGRQ